MKVQITTDVASECKERPQSSQFAAHIYVLGNAYQRVLILKQGSDRNIYIYMQIALHTIVAPG